MNSDRIRNRHGSTLAESLVAMGLFAVTAAAMGQLLAQHIRLQGTNGTTTAAITLAAREFEDMRALDYNDMVSRSSSVTAGAITYTVQTTVVADSPEPNLKSVTTRVSWAEPTGPQAYTAYGIFSDITR